MKGRVIVDLLLCMLAGHGCNIICFSYGVLQVYIYSYMRQFDPSLTMKHLHLHLPLLLGVAASTSWVQGYLARWVGVRALHCVNMSALCGWCVVLFWFSHSYAAVTTAMTGIGLNYGMLHVYLISTVVNRVSRYPSLASGIYGVFFGLSGIWGSILGSTFLNPWNVEKHNIDSNNGDYVFTDARVLERVPYLWLIIAGLMFIFLFPPLLFVSSEEKSAEVEEESDLATPKSSASCLPCGSSGDLMEELIPLQSKGTSKQVLVTLLFLSGVTVGVSTLCSFDLYKDFALKLPMYDESDIFLNNFGIALPVIGALGRLGWGVVGDYLPVWVLLIVENGLTAILQILMYVTRPSKEVYVVVCGLLAVTTGMMNVIPPVIKRYIGPENLARNFGFVFSGEVVACVWYVTFISLVGGIPDAILVCILSIPAVVALLAAIFLIGRY